MSNSLDESEVGNPKSQNGVPDLMTNNVIQESSDLGNQVRTYDFDSNNLKSISSNHSFVQIRRKGKIYISTGSNGSNKQW